MSDPVLTTPAYVLGHRARMLGAKLAPGEWEAYLIRQNTRRFAWRQGSKYACPGPDRDRMLARIRDDARAVMEAQRERDRKIVEEYRKAARE
jgi:hypothetical protein